MATLRKVTIICAECEKSFSYETRAQILKEFCPKCAKDRIDASKRLSRKRLADSEEDMSDAELEAKLDLIPDREIGWNRYISVFERIAT